MGPGVGASRIANLFVIPSFLAIVVSSCIAGPAAEPLQGVSAAASSPSPETSPSPRPTATAVASSTPTSGPRPVAQVVTTDLVVRSAPGTGAGSRIYEGRLASPTLLYVFDGPVSADGYDWYLVRPRDLSYLPDFHPVGWVAAAGTDGERWIGEATPDCPNPVLEEIVDVSEVATLACFGSQQLTLEGWITNCSTRDPARTSPYVWTHRCHVLHSDYSPDAAPSPGGLEIWFDADVGAHASDTRRLSRITGHFDDARSVTCPNVIEQDIYPAELQAMGFKPPPGWGTFQCRTAFVATAAEPISIP